MFKTFKKMGNLGWLYGISLIFIGIQSLFELLLPTKMQEIIDKGITAGDNSVIMSSGMQMLGISAVIAVAALLATFLISVVSSGFASRLRRLIFSKVINASNNEINEFGTASLITRTTNDITQLQHVVAMSRMALFAPFMFIGSIIMAVSTARSLSWVIIVASAAVAIFIVIVFVNATPLFKVQQKKLDTLNRVLRESLTGVRVIRAFNRVEKDSETFGDANKDLTATALKVARIMSVMMPFAMIMMNFTNVAVLWVSANYIDIGILEVGQMTAFIQYVMHIMFSLMMLSSIFVFLPRASVSSERINAILSSKTEILEVESPAVLNNNRTGLEFKNVIFRFKGAEQPVLKNISFTAKPGQTTAIIGSTGSGKSTMIDLIPRFYDIEQGEVLLNGVDIRNIETEKLRALIGLVPQQAVLFTGTIAENIRYGKEDATDQEVRDAAETAMALDFIESKPEGFDDMVSQGGTNLSGGQKQRLSIARALVKKPQVYIFDDSFSALDFKTDAKLRKTLKTKTNDSVVLIVAQRVSSIMDAEQIIVLSDGAVAGIGTHKELYSTCEVYKEIVLSQHSEEEIA